MLNANKRNISLNLKSPEGVRVLKELAAKADVLIENYAPGVLDRLGVGYSALSAINPRLIYGSATGLRVVGSQSRQSGDGPDRPGGVGHHERDRLCRRSAGQGGARHHRLHQRRASLRRHSHRALRPGEERPRAAGRDRDGRDRLSGDGLESRQTCSTARRLRPRTGNRHGGLAEAPYNVYPASDGYVAIISVNEVPLDSDWRARWGGRNWPKIRV